MRIIFFVFVIFLCGCQPSNERNAENKVVDKEALCNEISRQVSLKLMRNRGLIPCGSGGGTVPKVRMLALSFDYYKPLTIEEGRELVLTAVHEFTDAINRDERIRPYLAAYPFGSERVEIAIFVHDAKGRRLPTSAVTLVSCVAGICRYQVFHFDEKRSELVLKETLAEAEKQVQELASQKIESEVF